MNNFKDFEKKRYDQRGEIILSNLKKNNIPQKHDSDCLNFVLQNQYKFYEKLILDNLESGMDVLEIGSGTGEFSGTAISTGASVILTDISGKSLEAAKYRFKQNKNFKVMIADMENLPFESEKFNMVLSAGSLSYGNHKKVREEIFKVLKPNGYFICIDSLDHNPIYKINRLFHFLKGERRWETISRIPKIKLIKDYGKFGWEKHYYFGSFIWLMRIMENFLSKKYIIKASKFLDRHFANHHTAFNFVMIVRKNI